MGTGGTLPTNITQSVRLYNTTGIIEKEKGIYFCPFLSTTGTPLQVRSKWLSAFNTVATSDANYQNITISKWNPKDRELVVKGSPDDFRCVTEEGSCLNYLIVTRNVTRNEVTNTYYYAFFITDAQEVGNGSVRLSLQTDDFTNVFYLHNKKLTSAYSGSYVDVFNEKLKNCYVTRQHYDRFVETTTTGWFKETNLDVFSQIEEGFKYKRQFRDYKEYLNYGNPLTDSEKTEIENANSWSDLFDSTKKKILQISTAFLHIVMNSDAPILTHNFTGDVKQKHQNNLLPNTVVKNTLITLVYPIPLKIKELEKFYTNILNIFKTIQCYGYFEESPNTPYTTSGLYNPIAQDVINQFLRGDCILSEYVVNAYITRESSLINCMSYQASEIQIKFSFPSISAGYGDVNMDGKASFAILTNYGDKWITAQEQSQIVQSIADGHTYCTWSNNTPNDYTFGITSNVSVSQYTSLKPFMLFVEKCEPVKFNVNLVESDKQGTTIKSSFIEPVLSFNPYSFYSVSYLGRIEVPLNKLNYYEQPLVECNLTIAISESIKYSFIPTYQIQGKKQKMYSESIEQTFINSVTVVNDKLIEYMIANQAQMKNQYAVNDLNRDYGLIEAGISTVGEIGKGIGRGLAFGSPEMAIAGGVAGFVTGGVNLIETGIDWSKTDKTIAMNQKAKLADMGNLPSNLKQVGSDIIVDLSINEMGLYLNHYTIDELSYNSICKYLERFGYMVNLFDELHVNTRVGWDFVQIQSFDYEAEITEEQEQNIRQIFQNGVTLLHNSAYLTSGHNYEVILD